MPRKQTTLTRPLQAVTDEDRQKAYRATKEVLDGIEKEAGREINFVMNDIQAFANTHLGKASAMTNGDLLLPDMKTFAVLGDRLLSAIERAEKVRNALAELPKLKQSSAPLAPPVVPKTSAAPAPSAPPAPPEAEPAKENGVSELASELDAPTPEAPRAS